MTGMSRNFDGVPRVAAGVQIMLIASSNVLFAPAGMLLLSVGCFQMLQMSGT
jgi:hypothetical protein